MRRRLFTFVAALSLLMCLTTVWSAIAFSPIHFIVSEQGWETKSVWWYNERLLLEHIVRVGPSPPQRLRQADFAGFGWKENQLAFGFQSPLGVYFVTAPGYAREWWIPTWFLFLTSVILPTGWTVSYLRQRRIARRGLCPTCRYNLTANTSGICPECGTPIPSP